MACSRSRGASALDHLLLKQRAIVALDEVEVRVGAVDRGVDLDKCGMRRRATLLQEKMIKD
uniref:Uncharacterized protein n=1 Tax=Arundo donax TaxID=35708 RepID=A0A0A9CCH6_ARUDO